MVKQKHSDEIDFLELFKTFWEGKFLIGAFVVLAATLGFVYSHFAEPKFKIYAPYVFNFYPINSLQMCDREIKCMETDLKKATVASLGNEWEARGEYLVLTTKNPKDVGRYQDDFEVLGQLTTSAAYEEALNEITIIETTLINNLRNTETFAKNILYAKRIIHRIDNGEKVIEIGSVSLEKTAPNKSLILLVSIMVGGLLGCIFVSVKNSLDSRFKD